MPPTPLLATKLFAPPVRSGAVRRQRLATRLEDGLRQGHAVISAPAGFGKSTLVAQWLAATAMPVAWLSLEEDDREPLRFLAYLLAALRTVEPSLGEGVVRSLRSAQPPAPLTAATELVNALASGTNDVALVLDDYHAVDEGRVQELVTFLLDHAPPRLHLILTTREEPGLPLARLRARGRLVELRAADLRFAPDEAERFLTEAMGLQLATEDVRALERTTEGWAAGLQLAALSMHGRDDPTDFVRTFAGEHRHVLDYLSHEVLRGLDPRLRAFLLSTSVLGRLCGPVCDAVTGRSDGAETLQELERANLFLVPLDDERRWYRYHALFADVLRAEARRELGGDLRELHRRASRWLEAEGSPGEAIAHAVDAGDVERAARTLELAWRPMDRAFQIPTWRQWAARLPSDVLRSRPVLAVAVAWAKLGEGDLDGVEAWLAAAERWLDDRSGEDEDTALGVHERYVADETAFRALPARIAAARAYRAQATGDAAAGEAHARRAVEIAPLDDPGARALPAGLLGLAHWTRGELDDALETLRMGMDGFRTLGDAAAALSFTFAIADVLTAQGRLREASRTYREALRYAAEQDGPTLPGEAEAHVGLAEVHVELGDLEAAERELRAGEALGDAGVLTGDAGRLTAVRARVELALGDAATAHALLDDADRRQLAGPVPVLRPTDATRARLWLAQGRLADARAWAEASGAAGDLEPSYLNEYALLTVARVLLAVFRSEGIEAPIAEALASLDAVAEEAEAGGRTGGVIEALVLRSLASQAAGDDPGALRSLLRALRLAQVEGHHAVFVSEGPAMARLLRAAAREGADKAQLRRLLNAFDAASGRPRVLPDVVDPLSDRERDVLRLLRSELTGPQVARELGMSVHTLRSHTKSIYAKLGVHGRREAVVRADDLDLA
ncbi:MAG: LuxR C-terminal-related transcriptional regulator [Trueperaceae bacterium]|nr:LuxR C-terminal-related transcriptional regulator [Trueperaceae bacterium]